MAPKRKWSSEAGREGGGGTGIWVRPKSSYERSTGVTDRNVNRGPTTTPARVLPLSYAFLRTTRSRRRAQPRACSRSSLRSRSSSPSRSRWATATALWAPRVF